MKMRKVLAVLIASLLSMSIVAGCSSSGNSSAAAPKEEEVKLLLYHAMPEMTEWFTAFADKFNESHPGIVLEQETQKDASTLQVKYASGEDPDILAGSIISQQYMDMGKYIDLTPYAKWTDRIDQNLLESVKDPKTGKQFRMPLCRNAAGFFYNKQIFEELGLKEAKTWDELVSNLRTIKEKKPDVIPWYMFGGNYGHQSYFFIHGLRQTDIGTFETQKAITNNDSAVLQFDAPGGYVETYAEKILQLQQEGLIDSEEAVTGTTATAGEAFAMGKAAIISSGTYWLGGVVKQFPEVEEFIGIAPLVSMVDDRDPYIVSSQDSCVAVSAACQHLDAVEQVFDELFKVENMVSYSETRGAPSAFTDVTSNWSAISNEVIEKWDTYENVVQVLLPNSFGLTDMDKLGQELIVGAYTPAEFAAEYTNRWNAAFENQ